MTLTKEQQARFNRYCEANIETLSLGELADFALLLDIHREEVTARLEPNRPQPKREYPRFV